MDREKTISQGDLLRENFRSLSSRGIELASAFFPSVFKRSPRIENLFQDVDIAVQHETFMKALQFVVTNYENGALLKRSLGELGARHARYGVQPELYGVFGECLLDTLAHLSGSHWSLPIELAWRTAFENMAEIMLEGAATIELPPTAHAS